LVSLGRFLFRFLWQWRL